MRDIALTETADGGCDMGLEWASNLFNNVYLSLKIRRSTLFTQAAFGSRLHQIVKLSDENVFLARQYCIEALRWLVDIGRAERVDVETERDATDSSRLNIRIIVTVPSGEAQTFTLFHTVT